MAHEEVAVREYLEPAEASLIEDQAQCLRDKLLIRLLRRLACRVSEVLQIEERHVDFAGHQVRIEHEKIRINLVCPGCGARLGKTHAFCPECGISVAQAIAKQTATPHKRRVPIDRESLQLIREYIKRGGITEVNGKRMLFNFSRQWAWHIVKECAEKAGFTELENRETERRHHVSPHRFRDSFATDAMQKMPTMDDARLLQEILGHKSIETTMKYRKVKGAEVQDYYNKVIGGNSKR